MEKSILKNNACHLRIGGIEIETRVFPAPLAGYSDRTFRDIARRFGCHLVYSEMISAEGMIRRNRQTLKLVDFENEPFPVAVQLFGWRKDSLAEAAIMAQDLGADMIDLNAGCPVRKVVRNGAGAALLDTPDTLAEIVRAMKSAISIPLTVKLRTGTRENPDAALETGTLLESEGADALCLHGRSLEQVFRGSADWIPIKQLKQSVSIPIIGNGDIYTGEDAFKMVKITGCDAVMIGRGAIGNPWLFSQARAALDEIPANEAIYPTVPDRMQMAVEHLSFMVERKGERRAIKEFRKHAVSYMRGCPFAKQWRRRFFEIQTIREAKEFLTDMATY